MGNFSPWNWPSEAFTLPLAILIWVAFYGLLLLMIGLFFEFFRPAFSLDQARNNAERDVRHPLRELVRASENSAYALDKVMDYMHKHFGVSMTADYAAGLTIDDLESYEWPKPQRLPGTTTWDESGPSLNLAKDYIKRMQDAFADEVEPRQAYEEAAAKADYEFLRRANQWSYRWRLLSRKNWRGGIKRVLKAIAWFTVALYLLGILTANYHSWVYNTREAVGQDYRVVSVRYWDSEVTIEQNGCEMTFPVDVDSSTKYTFTGDGKADQDMVIIRGGVPVQPCLEHGIN